MMYNSRKRVVSKFGGTSMGDAECMLRSAKVSYAQNASLIVVSATSGTTNDLIEIGRQAECGDWEQVDRAILKIKSRHLKIANDLKSSSDLIERLNHLFTELESIAKGIFYLKDASLKAMDVLQSLGERMSSLLFVEAYNLKNCNETNFRKAYWLDVRSVLKTDHNFSKAKPLTELIIKLCNESIVPDINNGKVFITQGFVGQTEEGATTTLGRGGSDYSAAILAEGISADILEIWTDVPGIATTDPRITKQARRIEEISFKEASELATFGAKVLHPATLLPAIRKNIPVFVGSSFESESLGTWVQKEARSYPLIRAMAVRKKQVLVTVTTPEMLHAHGFLLQIFKVFNDHKVSIDAITTSEISVSMTLDDSALMNRKLIQDLSQFAEVQVEENLCLVSLIGNNINHTPGLSKQIFETIPDINVRMICLGASKHNFCFLVNDEQGNEVIKRLHKQFIEN